MNRILIILVFLLAGSGLCAQTYQEQLKAIRSSAVEEKDGKSFYIHTVKKGQTLYMISKAYGVEVNDIINENPAVREGLKADQKLYIPFPAQKKSSEIAKSEIPQPATGNQKPANSNQKPGASNQPPATDHKPLTTSQQPPATDHQPLTTILKPCGSDTSAASRTYNVVLMLPLYLEEVRAMDPATANPDSAAGWNPSKYLPFYEGFMIAADSLGKKGLRMILHVYDLGKDSIRTRELLKKNEMQTADLIIGLLFHKNFQTVARFAHEHRIPLVNPLSERPEVIKDNDMVFKAMPSRSTQFEAVADYFRKNMYRGQIILVRNGQYKDREAPERLKKECLSSGNLSVFLAEGQDAAISRLSKTRENTVVAFTDNSVYALDLMRRFYELRNDYPIALVGLPEWEKIDGLETDFLNGLGTRIIAPLFTDYSQPGVRAFVRRFYAQYKTDPPSLAFQGFDVGYYFLSALMKFGKDFPRCIQDYRLPCSQTSFEFTKSSNGGFENRHWSIYKYENFRLLREN